MFHVKQFDVVVIGGGHAGIEASLAASRMGLRTALITMDAGKIGEMSCNPSIGGVGKGQLVKEIDALGGEMGKTADLTGIQFKRLNTRKGSSVQSSRCQSDKKRYAQRMQEVVSLTPGLEVRAAEVKELLVENGRVVGVKVVEDGEFHEWGAGAVVITSGTFMRGLIHVGFDQLRGGRIGEKPSEGLSDCLRSLGFTILRLKTGTPARLLRDSIDFSSMEEQGGDIPPRLFSFWGTKVSLPQICCYLVHTNQSTHDTIRANLHRSPLYSGSIKGVGPRYCPSIEDKVVKFPDKPRHQLFFEPESLDSDWIYPNGISTSLPADVQEAFIRTIPGCADVKIARFGYAVEYDCVDARQLHPTLESRLVRGLYLAGQVNGTSGYEEAAAQGLLAGINAALLVKGEEPLILSRAQSYIGVMVDDLTSLGVNEPYRMFTSRAEYRLSLREDNADLRLSPIGHRIGLLTDEQSRLFEERKAEIEKTKVFLRENYAKATLEVNAVLEKVGTGQLKEPQSLVNLLKRPEIDLQELSQICTLPISPSSATAETVEIEVKYEGYIAMQSQEIERLQKMQEVPLPDSLNYGEVIGLSIETREKLGKLRPRTLAAAAKISGVTPAALTAVLFHVKHKKGSHEARA